MAPWLRRCVSSRPLSMAAAAAVAAIASPGSFQGQGQGHVSRSDAKKALVVDGVDEFSTIIVGGGTAGCTTAYLLSKWMEDNAVPGHVLLIDRGVTFSPEVGPSPRMEQWYGNWCEFGECHEARNQDGSAYPVVPSDHRGLGGCSTHDTRITFQLRPEQKSRMAQEMGWTAEQLDTYFQTALNFMPLSPAIDKAAPIPFYDAVMTSLSAPEHGRPLQRLPDDEHKAGIVIDSVAASSLAMYTNGDTNVGAELRWTPTYLMLDGVRPGKLKIVTDAVVEKINLGTGTDSYAEEGLVAEGVSIAVGGESCVARLQQGGRVALTSGAIGSAAILQRSGVGPAAHLQSLGIPVLVDNPSVGHGIDHEEIAVLHEWLDKWNTAEGEVPRGGAMGWPLVIFASFRPELRDLFSPTTPPATSSSSSSSPRSSYFQAHFGAGYAEPYTSFPSVVATPNCLRPDHSEAGGYRVLVRSTDPRESCLLVQGQHRADLETIAQGVFSTAHLFRCLEQDGVVGRQIEPDFAITAENRERVIEWIRQNHYTVFHWACTCQAGKSGRVCDESFRLRNPASARGVVPNLFVGSAASLPEVSEANPHLTISAFAVALAERLSRSTALGWARGDDGEHQGVTGAVPELAECVQAREDLRAQGGTVIRREGEERPLLGAVAQRHDAAWERAHPEEK